MYICFVSISTQLLIIASSPQKHKTKETKNKNFSMALKIPFYANTILVIFFLCLTAIL